MQIVSRLQVSLFCGLIVFAVPAQLVLAQQAPSLPAGTQDAGIPTNPDLQRLTSAAAQQPAPPIPALQGANAPVPPSNIGLASLNGPGVSQPSAPAVTSSPPPPQDLNIDSDPAVLQMARDQAFNQLTLNTLPMTPDQIQKLRNLFADSQRAATVSPGGAPPKAVALTQPVSLDPGSTPPIVRLSQGYVTALVFLDSTGAPWPLTAYDVGNPGAFNIQWDHTSNILLIQSSAMYTMGNLVVQLKGLNTPVSISLIPGQPIVDYRIDLRIQGFGPNARPGPKNTLPEAANVNLINVLDGIPPDPKAKSLRLPGSASLAWLVGEKMYLRSRLTLLSPAWIASMTSADGMNAYEIPQTPSILVSDNDGKIFNLRVEGY